MNLMIRRGIAKTYLELYYFPMNSQTGPQKRICVPYKNGVQLTLLSTRTHGFYITDKKIVNPSL
jgi:hypothetical protein